MTRWRSRAEMGAVHHLSIDIETYSDVDIGEAGLYRYAQSPAFAVLLFAWSLDGKPVQVADFTAGEELPPEIRVHLFSPGTIKHAYNAAFEWYCLSRHFGIVDTPGFDARAWLPQWRCTMLHGLYCGYPAKLADIGPALGLPAERQKLSIGKALIRYFCMPCAPTRANGGRTRNLPAHDPDKWALFKEYNAQDVVTELEVERRLARYPVPDSVQAQWVTDQRCALRGVTIDRELVAGAIAIGEAMTEALTAEARQITGLDNPNSLPQLKPWLSAQLGEAVDSLTKETLEDLLGRDDLPGEVRRLLRVRQALGKTSNAKYTTMETCVCGDGRVRGLLQFYGANRTGRWAGRLVQIQNLPRTYIPGELLPLARELVRERRGEDLELLYGNAQDALSQLIRTAFIAAPGYTLVDADFSAIEARMLAWLAGEEWVLGVFRTTGKIYEATAAQMFGVPVETIVKGHPNHAYRQKGKVATLALGYNGGPGALVNMGALRMGIPEEELPDMVSRWRRANPRIVRFWYAVNDAAVEAVTTGRAVALNGGRLVLARECDPENELEFLTIRLPSGRKLYYAKPHMTTNRFGAPAVGYYDVNQKTHKWSAMETYGGKLVENITQACARDCMAEAIERLEAAGHRVLFSIHDEVVVEAPRETASLQAVEELMSIPPSWAPDLPLGADGWVNEFFKKD